MSRAASGRGGEGVAGAGDELDLRAVYRLGWRLLPFVRSVLPELWATAKRVLWLLPGVLVLTVFLSMAYYDALINGLIQARPISRWATLFLWLDPAAFTTGDALSVGARQVLRQRLVLATVALVVIATPLVIGGFLYWLRVMQRINQEMRERLLGRLHAMSLRHHGQTQIGDLIYRFYQDSAMGTGLLWTLLDPFLRILAIAWAVVIVALYDLRLAVVLGIVSLGLGWAVLRLSGAFRGRFRAARETTSDLTSQIQQSLSAIRVIKAYGAEARECERFERASLVAFDAAARARAGYAGVGVLMVLAVVTVELVVGYDLVVRVASGAAIGLGAAWALLPWAVWNPAAFVEATGRFRGGGQQARGLGRSWLRLQDMVSGIDRFFELMELESGLEEAPDAVPFVAIEREVAFRGVSFAYAPERPVLHEVDFSVPAGALTAIVGPTGSGKTTLLHLLLRLFDPLEGRIEVDGRDLRSFRLDTLRSRVSIALQQNLLFGGSILENIRYAVPSASETQVRQAARVACAADFIESLPLGYETLLGERGARLSSGQRQRLGIARAVLKDPPVLVLDEPTAALDAETELEVLDRLSRWGHDRVILMVTHRLSTIRRADHIVYLGDGRVLEQGSHEDLMARVGGAYRQLVELESRGLADADTSTLHREAAG